MVVMNGARRWRRFAPFVALCHVALFGPVFAGESLITAQAPPLVPFAMGRTRSAPADLSVVLPPPAPSSAVHDLTASFIPASAPSDSLVPGARDIASLFAKSGDSHPGLWTFQVGLWFPYSTAVLGQAVSGTAGLGTTFDERGNIIGLRYYSGGIPAAEGPEAAPTWRDSSKK